MGHGARPAAEAHGESSHAAPLGADTLMPQQHWQMLDPAGSASRVHPLPIGMAPPFQQPHFLINALASAMVAASRPCGPIPLGEKAVDPAPQALAMHPGHWQQQALAAASMLPTMAASPACNAPLAARPPPLMLPHSPQDPATDARVACELMLALHPPDLPELLEQDPALQVCFVLAN